MRGAIVLAFIALVLLPGCLAPFDQLIGKEKECDPLRADPSHNLTPVGPRETNPRRLADSFARAMGDELSDASPKDGGHYLEYATLKGRVILGDPGGPDQSLDYKGENAWPGSGEAAARANVTDLLQQMQIPVTDAYGWTWETNESTRGLTAGFLSAANFSYQKTGIWVHRWPGDANIRVILGPFFEFPPLERQVPIGKAREVAVQFAACVAAKELKHEPPTPLRLEGDRYGGLLLVADGTPMRFTLAYRFHVTFAEKPCGEESVRHHLWTCEYPYTHDVAVDAVTGLVVEDWASGGRTWLYN